MNEIFRCQCECPICKIVSANLDFERCFICGRMIYTKKVDGKFLLLNFDIPYLKRSYESSIRSICIECVNDPIESNKTLKELQDYHIRMVKERKRKYKLVKMHLEGSPMSIKLSNTPGIAEKEKGFISLANHPQVKNYKSELAIKTLNMGGDTLINIRVRFFKDKGEKRVTATGVVLKMKSSDSEDYVI